MAGFNEARDFPLDAYIKYNQGILNNAQTQSPQNPTGVTASPIAGALGGAQMGYGFGQQLPTMFPDCLVVAAVAVMSALIIIKSHLAMAVFW